MSVNHKCTGVLPLQATAIFWAHCKSVNKDFG